MSSLEHTSVPAWARGRRGGTAAASPGEGGNRHLLVGVGTAGRAQVAAWEAAADVPAEVVLADTAADVGLDETLAAAHVGVRIRIAAPLGDCLQLRAAAVTAGVEDDELELRPTGHGPISLYCSHCSAVTNVEAAVDDVVACRGCGRELLVYYHVSRNTGRFLGFQHDAERIPGTEVS